MHHAHDRNLKSYHVIDDFHYIVHLFLRMIGALTDLLLVVFLLPTLIQTAIFGQLIALCKLTSWFSN